MAMVAAAVMLAVAVGYSGNLGYHWYAALRRNRAIWQGNAMLDQGQPVSAMIHAQRVLQADPNDVDAALIMGKGQEKFRPDEAIPWRQHVLDNRPNDLENAIALTKVELQAGRIVEAQRLLDKLQPLTAKNPDYHAVAGAVALARNNPQKAEEHFARALELFPDHAEYQLMLGKAQSVSRDPLKSAEGRARLMRVSQIKEHRSNALAAVIDGMLRSNENDAALSLANTLADTSDASFEDQLLRVDVAYRVEAAEFSSMLQTLQQKSLSSTDHVLEVVGWLQAHRLELLAVDWIKRMPEKITSDARLKLAAAQAYANVQDWKRAKDLLETGSDWGVSKFLALALQARICREEGRQAQFQASWNAAVVEAGLSQGALVNLAMIVRDWKWQDEYEKVLWKLSERPCPPDWIFKPLRSRCEARLDSYSLQKLWLRMHELYPASMPTTNDLAYMLLLRGEREEEAQKMAADAYGSAPSNTHYASTYAYALYRQGKNEEALKILSALSEEVRRDPSIAVCYVAVLAANNNKAKAAELYPGIDRSRLLPEEKRLLDQAGRTLKAP